MASKSDVEAFLSDMRYAINRGMYMPHNTTKNRDTLMKLGLTTEDVIEEILKLSYDNYYEGPEDNENNINDDKLWIFKTKYFYQIIYVKLQILYKHDKRLVIWSFHIDNM